MRCFSSRDDRLIVISCFIFFLAFDDFVKYFFCSMKKMWSIWIWVLQKQLAVKIIFPDVTIYFENKS